MQNIELTDIPLETESELNVRLRDDEKAAILLIQFAIVPWLLKHLINNYISESAKRLHMGWWKQDNAGVY